MRRLLALAGLAMIPALLAFSSPAEADRGGKHWRGSHGHSWHGHKHRRHWHGHRHHSHSSVHFGFLFATPPVVYRPPTVVYAPPPIVHVPPPVVYHAPPRPAVVLRDGYDQSGNYCREYQRDAVVGGQLVASYGVACLRPDGRWQIVR